MIETHWPADPATHELAARLAVACRRIVQACLREEEWLDADREFYLVIREGLELFRCGEPECPKGGNGKNVTQL